MLWYLGAGHASTIVLEDCTSIAEQRHCFQLMYLQSACRVNRMLGAGQDHNSTEQRYLISVCMQSK